MLLTLFDERYIHNACLLAMVRLRVTTCSFHGPQLGVNLDPAIGQNADHEHRNTMDEAASLCTLNHDFLSSGLRCNLVVLFYFLKGSH